MKQLDGNNRSVIQLSRKAALGWIAAFLVVAVWTFVIGVLVGRDTAPVRFDMAEIHQQLTEIRTEILKKEKAKITLDSDPEGAKQDLAFYEELKKTEPAPPVLENVPAAPATEAPAETAAAKPVPLPAEPSVEKAPDKVTPSGKYTIQVASLRDLATAEEMVKKMKARGFPAFTTTAEISGITWHRVRIGEFTTREAAGEMFRKMGDEGVKGILVVW